MQSRGTTAVDEQQPRTGVDLCCSTLSVLFRYFGSIFPGIASRVIEGKRGVSKEALY